MGLLEMISKIISKGSPIAGLKKYCGFANHLQFFFFFVFFRAALVAYGGSQASGQIGAGAAGLHHSSWQCQILNPLGKVRDRTFVLTDASHNSFPLNRDGNSKLSPILIQARDTGLCPVGSP